MPKRVMQVLLDDEDYETVESMAREERTSMSAVGRRLILRGLGR